MPFVPAKTTPCAVPSDFDHEAYGAIAKRMGPLSEVEGWSGYASGFNAVAFRFAAADEATTRLHSALSGSGALSPAGPRYAQEEALFSLFVNAVSVLECFYFAFYNIGACLGLGGFRVGTPAELRAIYVSSTVKAYEFALPADAFTGVLARTASSPEFASLKAYRDFLTHRGTPKRMHSVKMAPDGRVDMSAVTSATVASNPKDVPSSWVSDFELTPSMATPARLWLAGTINGLMSAGGAFLAQRT